MELLVSLVSEHKELYDKFVWFWQAHKYLLSSSEWQASVRSVKLRSATLCTGVFLFYIKRHLMSGNEFACSLGSSSAKIARVWTQKTLANNARRCVRAFRVRERAADDLKEVCCLLMKSSVFGLCDPLRMGLMLSWLWSLWRISRKKRQTVWCSCLDALTDTYTVSSTHLTHTEHLVFKRRNKQKGLNWFS